ncbi:MAG: thymidine phosphorylase [Tissierellia bacterium]|nr:thymidine phosphorylase [Tissierellia bacterium]
MRSYDLIYKKRQGEKLSREEISFFIRGYVEGRIPDYQASAFLMAAFLKGLDDEETYYLTMEMLASGDSLDLGDLEGICVDKHSTGGVGDKTTLTLAPLLASLGLKVAKMSGRGLGHTGGTIDKLEAIPGFRTELSEEEFKGQVNRIGLSLISQTKNLVPADKLLYSLRDVTATVDHPSLIASSIMSKKLAAGSDYILLDVKVGSGAFLKTLDEAIHLARIMVSIGEMAGKKTRALITSMDQPLGYMVGNSLEIQEAMGILGDGGAEDLRELTLALAAQLLLMTGKSTDYKDAYKEAEAQINNGLALESFFEMVEAQGGKIKDMAVASFQEVIFVEEDCYLAGFDTQMVGEAAALLGAGRQTMEDEIDLTAGIYLPHKIGDKLSKGELLARLYTSRPGVFDDARKRLLEALSFSKDQPQKVELIRALVYKEGEEIKEVLWS